MSVRTVIPTLLAPALVLSACSAEAQEPAPPATQEEAQETAAPGGPIPALPVGEAFAEPTWGFYVQTPWEQVSPLVTADRVIALDGPTVLALGPDGQEAWSAQWAHFEEADRVPSAQGYPLLRLVTPEIVAVADAGRVQGEGLATGAYEARVTLLDVEDGSVLAQAVVPGAENAWPAPGPLGLGFHVAGTEGDPNNGTVAVLPSGEVESISVTEHEIEGAITVGEHVFALWGLSPGVPGTH